MRVLWATSLLPDPTFGGGPSIEHEHLRWASRHHEVTLVTGGLRPGDPVPPALAELSLVEVVAAGAADLAPLGRVGTFGRSLSGPPLELLVAQPRVQRIAAELEHRSADLVHVAWAESAPVAVQAARRFPTAFFACDSFTRHAERQLGEARSVRQRVYWRLQRARTRAWERGYCAAGEVAVVSPVDAAALGELGVRAMVVPSALGDEWFEPSVVGREPELVTFIGALDYGPNVEAVGWLLHEVWPRIRAVRTGARLRVIGRHPVPSLAAAVAVTAGAELLADVPEVRSHYGAAAAVLLPIRLGSGVRTKVLHAFACRAPVVATARAVEGLDVRDGDQVLLADDAAGLAAATLRTLDDPRAAAARADRAAEIAAAHRTERVISSLEALWHRAATSGS